MRSEFDSIGGVEVPKDALYGSNTARGVENFAGLGRPLGEYRNLVAAMARVKRAAAMANLAVGAIEPRLADAICRACDEIAEGRYDDQFVVPLAEGSGGTSINMNINEVIANRAGALLGDAPGSYASVHPNDHVNLGQSTNDVVPTAIKLGCILASAPLFLAGETLVAAFRAKADEYREVLRVGRTCMQAAQPMTYGQLFDGHAASVLRAVGAVRKACDDLAVVPMGGTAIGTGLGAAPGYGDAIAGALTDVFGFPVSRAENAFDGMASADGFVRLSSELRNLSSVAAKIAADLVILGSDGPSGLGEVMLPAVQPGSSIMAGKVNPVICMAVQQVAFAIHGHDATVALAAQAGQMEINHFEPVMAQALFESLSLVTRGCELFAKRCICGLKVDTERSYQNLAASFAVSTVFLRRLGYARVAKLAKQAQAIGARLTDLAVTEGLLSESELREVLRTAAHGRVDEERHSIRS
ncbi:lyase family protein [Defluviimonas sp. WL0002]|uniref:Lyase family protein n=1 Tax=Albidovulum marisflavi TaxID=2984159 RepID=A0ABT2Z8S3_9RHOB|nr:lyase family protein [Defluviimonas sp. WL0002]MCV2867482.1 lyase family protein [Defluviimonas sp. WL0002]